MHSMALADDVLPVLREGIANGRWVESMPPAMRLSAEVGVHRRAVRDALTQLVYDGTLIRVGNVYRIGGTPPEDTAASPELQARAAVIIGLYGTHVTPQSLAALPADDQQALIPGRHADLYGVLRVAVESFRGHTATAVQSALGWRDSTSEHTTATARRKGLAKELDIPVTELSRLERLGSLTLAGHIESITHLLDIGLLLRLDEHATPPAPSDIARTIQDLQTRVRNLELGQP